MEDCHWESGRRETQIRYEFLVTMGFPGVSDSKESACNVGDLGLSPGLGRSPGGGHGNPLQYFGLENSMDRGAWLATVPGIAKSRTQLRNFHFNFHRQA